MNYSNYPNYVPFEKMTKKDNFPKFIVVHHSASGVDNADSIQRYHITDPGHLWENTGYHWIINRGGLLVAGRPENYHGAHVAEQNMNRQSIGICLCGNFDKNLPDEGQIKTLTQLLKDLMAKYNIPAMSIFPHRHYALNSNGTPYKSCYGSKLGESWARDLVSNIPPPKKDCDVEVGIAKKGLIETIINFLKTLL